MYVRVSTPKFNKYVHYYVRLATEHEHLLKTKYVPPDSVVNGAVPLSSCRLPLRNVPGWHPNLFSPGLWVAPKRIRGAGAGTEEVGERRIPPW